MFCALQSSIDQLEEESSFTLQRRLPYLCLADCLLNTSVRDGLNSLPLEYVQVQGATRPDNPGVMLLSEFTSSMRVMRGAIRINPWKVCLCIQYLYTCACMNLSVGCVLMPLVLVVD